MIKSTTTKPAIARAPVEYTPPAMDRYSKQSDEWQRFVCTRLVAPIEQALRALHEAACLAATERKMRNPEPVFRTIVSHIPNWTDEECAKELDSVDRDDVDACIRMAVRSRAIVMALAVSRKCKETIKVPNTYEFFRRVMYETAREHRYDVFGSPDLQSRKRLRNWISENVVKQLMSLVPVSVFTEEEEKEDYDDKKEEEEKIEEEAPVVCDDKTCAVSPLPVAPPKEEEKKKEEEDDEYV